MTWRIKDQSRRKNKKIRRRKGEGKVSNGDAKDVTYQ